MLSYRSSDEEGRALAPSPFIDDVAELFDAGVGRRAGAAGRCRTSSGARRRRPRPVTFGGRARRRLRRTPPPRERPLPRRPWSGRSARRRCATCATVRSSPAARWSRLRRARSTGWSSDSSSLVSWSRSPRRSSAAASCTTSLERVIAALGGPVTPASLPAAQELLSEQAAELPDALGAGRPDAVRAAIRRGIEADLRRYLISEAADGCEWVPLRARAAVRVRR